MEAYPASYIAHNVPLVVLFGLDPQSHDEIKNTEQTFPLLEEKGIYIASDLPNLRGAVAEELLSGFRYFDARNASWNSRPGRGKMGTMGFTYRAVGRVGWAPVLSGVRCGYRIAV